MFFCSNYCINIAFTHVHSCNKFLTKANITLLLYYRMCKTLVTSFLYTVADIAVCSLGNKIIIFLNEQTSSSWNFIFEIFDFIQNKFYTISSFPVINQKVQIWFHATNNIDNLTNNSVIELHIALIFGDYSAKIWYRSRWSAIANTIADNTTHTIAITIFYFFSQSVL